MAAIFDEWARRYAENPKGFTVITPGGSGNGADYGASCALYFQKIEAEMVARGTLPA